MPSDRNTPEPTYKNWLILLAALFVAFLIWLCWLAFGMQMARNYLVSGVDTPSSTTQAKAAPRSASAALPDDDKRSAAFTELGQTGDSFGGLNALLTAIAGAFVFWAGVMQYQTLKQALEATVAERRHREQQEFESLFFQLLQLSASATEKFETTNKAGKEIRKGSRALDSFARTIFKRADTIASDQGTERLLERLLTQYFLEFYDNRPSLVGPYFRLLYQIFKHIAESNLPEKQKISYANIARGQISEGAVFLLALNGMTKDGQEFAPLIERFGLLKHMHSRYLEAYRDALKLGYRERAFLGSAERDLPEHAWVKHSLLADNWARRLDDIRSAAQTEAAFTDGYLGVRAEDD